MTDEQLNLLHRYLDGTITEEEIRSLDELLRNNEEARAELRSLATIDAKWQQLAADGALPLALNVPLDTPSKPERVTRRFAWPSQIAAGLVAGLVVGLMGVGVVWAVGSPMATARVLNIAHGDFESMPAGPIPQHFPIRVGEWCGNPAKVIHGADGNQSLRFIATANVKDNPSGFASNCSVFQLVDLTTLRQELNADQSRSQFTVELSARFRRVPAPNDADLSKLKGSVRVFLFQAEPESIGEEWPQVVQQAEALGKKSIDLKPGEAATISASCILDSDATVALIAVAAGSGVNSKTSIPLGGYFVDDVKLTVIKQPKLPVQLDN
jgi:hypothetical protein